MTRWTCPKCGRELARAGEPHACADPDPAEAVIAAWPEANRAIYARLVERLGPVRAEPARTGVALRARRKFAEVRPRPRGVSLELALPRPVAHKLLARTFAVPGGRTVHSFRLSRPEDVDELILAWLVEARDA